MVLLRSFFLIFCLFSFCSICAGQQGKNPFDLESRSDSLIESSELSEVENPFDLVHRSPNATTNYNPFDIQVRPEKNANRLESLEPVRRKAIKPNADQGNFNFILYTGILILFTFLFTLYRPLILQIYRAFVNDNILKLLHRDQIGIIKAPYIIWYLFFFLSLSAFLLQAIEWYLPGTFENLWKNFGALLLLISGLFLAKHLILILIGTIFPLSKEMGIYSFTIVIFSIILSLILIPFNLLAAFGPVEWQWIIVVLGLITILLCYAYRSLRAIFLTSSKWGQHIFHFFIYLCTVEIAPVIVLFKLVISTQ